MRKRNISIKYQGYIRNYFYNIGNCDDYRNNICLMNFYLFQRVCKIMAQSSSSPCFTACSYLSSLVASFQKTIFNTNGETVDKLQGFALPFL